MLYLKLRVVKGAGAAEHGWIWWFGASVDRLVPVIQIKREFRDFFEDRSLNNFTPIEDFCFSFLGILGWALGFIVLAAMATITHG
jgi:hypothetical protein